MYIFKVLKLTINTAINNLNNFSGNFVGNVQNIFMEHDLYILMILALKKNRSFWPIQCIVGYCYNYIRATYDWFCGPGLHIYIYIHISIKVTSVYQISLDKYNKKNLCMFLIKESINISRDCVRTVKTLPCKQLLPVHPAPHSHFPSAGSQVALFWQLQVWLQPGP